MHSGIVLNFMREMFEVFREFRQFLVIFNTNHLKEIFFLTEIPVTTEHFAGV